MLFGLPADANVTYELFLAGLHPEDRERTDRAVQEALLPDGPGQFNVRYRTVGLEDEIERWVAATGKTVFSEEAASARLHVSSGPLSISVNGCVPNRH